MQAINSYSQLLLTTANGLNNFFVKYHTPDQCESEKKGSKRIPKCEKKAQEIYYNHKVVSYTYDWTTGMRPCQSINSYLCTLGCVGIQYPTKAHAVVSLIFLPEVALREFVAYTPLALAGS